MKAFSISDWTLINTLTKRGNTQDEVITLLLNESATIQSGLGKNIIVIDIEVNNNSAGNFWEGSLLWTTVDSGIVFH